MRPTRSSGSAGLARLAIGFLVVSMAIETAYSWPGLTSPYYLVKLAGWVLLARGLMLSNRDRPSGMAFQAAGWGWLAANFWRAVADRLARVAAGQVLRLGSVETWFAAACLLICAAGLSWSLSMSARQRQ